VAEKVSMLKKLLQEIVLPEFHEIKAELRVITTEIKRLDEKIESVRNEFGEKFKRLNEKIDVEIRRLDQRIDSVGQRIEGVEREIRATRQEFKLAIDIHERLAAVEAKISNKSR